MKKIGGDLFQAGFQAAFGGADTQRVGFKSLTILPSCLKGVLLFSLTAATFWTEVGEGGEMLRGGGGETIALMIDPLRANLVAFA